MSCEGRFKSRNGSVTANVNVAENAGEFTLTRRVSNRRIPPLFPVLDERFVIALRAKPFQPQRTMGSFPGYNSLIANLISLQLSSQSALRRKCPWLASSSYPCCSVCLFLPLQLSRWRQRARLIHAMQSLAAGESVTNAALEAGYSSTSAFISMFRKQLGTTPARYMTAAD
jgi:AraC-like DNA-binding protein